MSKNPNRVTVKTIETTRTKKWTATAPAPTTCQELPIVASAPTSRENKYRVVLQFGGKEHVDELNPFIAKARDAFAQAGAQKLGWVGDMTELADQIVIQTRITEERIGNQLNEARGEHASSTIDIKQRLLDATPPEVQQAALRFLKNRDLIAELLSDFRALGVVGEESLCVASYLIATSRHLDQPLGGVVQAASSSGKSYVTNAAMDMMPEEDVVRATDISPQALYYMPPDSLRHKIVYVSERKQVDTRKDVASANNTLAFRELMSNGKLTKYVTDAGPQGLTTRKVEQNGPIAYLETTTQENILEEDQNRMLQLQTDESSEQTARIIDQITANAAGNGIDKDARAAVLAKHRTAQRMLKPLDVVIPYASLITIPRERVTARRAMGQFLNFIKTVALLRQAMKKPVNGRINATLADYKIAYDVMLPVLRRSLSTVSERVLQFFDCIAEALKKGDSRSGYFTRQACCEWSGLSLTEVRNRLETLEELELVHRAEIKEPGSRAILYGLAKNNRKRIKLSGLLTPEVLEEMIAGAKAAPCTQAASQPVTDNCS